MSRAFLYTVIVVDIVVAIALVGLLTSWKVPQRTIVCITAAFLLQISFYLVPGFPEVRQALEQDFRPASIALIAVFAAVSPYVIYSLPTGLFQFSALLKLTAISAIPTFVFVLWPTHSPRLTWQDAVALGTVAVVELGKVFRQIYLSPRLPDPQFLRLMEPLGRLMMIWVVAMAFLSIRKLDGAGYRIVPSVADWKSGVKNFLFFLPAGALFAFGAPIVHYQPEWPNRMPEWSLPFALLAGFALYYLGLAIYEELLFRGILQNLLEKTIGNQTKAQVLASILFGLAHITFRRFPNWNLVILGTLAGWFYGRAYRERRNVLAPSITHSLVVILWRLFGKG